MFLQVLATLALLEIADNTSRVLVPADFGAITANYTAFAELCGYDANLIKNGWQDFLSKAREQRRQLRH